MEIRSIHEICGIKPFIEFEIMIEGKSLRLEGREWYCIDRLCNCKMANILIHETGGKRLTQLIYGWRPYKYYIKQHFFKSDCESMVKGDLSFPEPKNDLNRMILTGFHSWLQQGKKGKDGLFAERYKKFREKIVEMGEEKIDNFVGGRVLSENEMIEVLRKLTQSDIANMIELYEKITKK